MNQQLLILLLFAAEVAHATTCSPPPPCGRLYDWASQFVGKVVSIGPPVGELTRTSRVKVVERFYGLASETKEVVVGASLELGAIYLIDGSADRNGIVWPSICGLTSDIRYGGIEPYLKTLREEVRFPKRRASISVKFETDYAPMPGTPVALVGPKGRIASKADKNGIAQFRNLVPGHYRIDGLPAHRRLDSEMEQRTEFSLRPSACPSLNVYLRGDSAVNGTLQTPNGRLLAGVVVELARGEISFLATTGSDGQFRFEGISEGEYNLGINIRQRNSSLPRSLAQDGIHIAPGSVVSNIRLVVPDPGGQRTITLKVVDQSGRPVSGAYIEDARASDVQGSLHGPGINGPKTDAHGEATIFGWQSVGYTVSAFWQNGPAAIDWFRSDAASITAGEGPVP